MSLGFEQAGFDICAAVEIDPIHCATHHFNFPYSTTICASVERITGDNIRQRAGIGDRDIDVVFGGAPCQGFSLIGKRALDDPRNQLVKHYVRLVKELRPKYCVFENVKGLTIGKHRAFLDELIESLKQVGYRVTQPHQVLNAADYGVPQNRQRLFLLGARSDQAFVQYPEASKKQVTVAEAILDLPDAETFDELLISDEVRTSWKSTSRYAKVMRGLASDPADFSHPRAFDKNALTSSLRTAHTQLSRSRFAATEPGCVEPISRFLRLAPEGRCNTLRAGTDSARGAFTSPRPIHPLHDRVITVREAARLHSYPDWFRFHATKWHGFRQVGNSVPPLLARAVAREIMKALGATPTRTSQKIKAADATTLTMEMGPAARMFGVPKNTIAQRSRPRVADRNQEALWEDING